MIDDTGKFVILETNKYYKRIIITKFYIELFFLLLKLYNMVNLIRKIIKYNMHRNSRILLIATLMLVWASYAIYNFDNYTLFEICVDVILDPTIIILSLLSVIKEKYYNKIKTYLLVFVFIAGYYSLFWGFVGLSSIQSYENMIYSSSDFLSIFSLFTGVFFCVSTFKLKYEIK